jgi:hypothetical protein
VIQRDKEAKAVYKALRNDTALPDYGKTGASIPKPEDVTITILNGTGTAGLASKIRDELEAKGFDVREIGNADRRDFTTTTIFYKFGAQPKAALLNEEFPGAVVKEGSAKQDTDILIVLGADQAPSASPSPG